MSMVSTQNSFTNNSPSLHTGAESDDQATEANLKSLLGSFTNGQHQENSMDRGAPSEYTQSGLQSPYQAAFTGTQSEGTSADHSSAAQYSAQQEIPSNSYSTSATPTSDFGVYPGSARSGSFPDQIHNRRYHPASNHSGSSGGMAQPQSPSMPLQDGRSNHQNQIKSDQEVPIDPSIAASSPTYPQSQYSPYPPQHDMQHGYPQHPGTQMYAQPRPDWAGYAGQHHGMPAPYQTSGVPTPTSAAPASVRGPNQHPLSQQIYSFVPIPGAQQHKRPRRRYEEIERMYKCGWQGCEKAYGTLNHLNAHVTMQSHGNKRTPEEFKEIRKEWKARKKEEETMRKQQEDRERTSAVHQNGGPPSGSVDPDSAPPSAGYQAGRSQVQLPPIGYQPGAQVPGQYQPASNSVQQLQDYGHPAPNAISYSGYPASPYSQAPQHMYNQPNGNGTGTKYEQ